MFILTCQTRIRRIISTYGPSAWRFVLTYGTAIGVVITAGWTAYTWNVGERHQAENSRAQAENETWKRDHQTELETWQRNFTENVQKHVIEQDRAIALRDSQRPFLEKQLAFYFEAAKATAKLATLPPERTASEDWAWAQKRFWELYWGELGVVESTDVAAAMVHFGELLRSLEDCVKTAKDDSSKNCTAQQKALEGPSLQLAHNVRTSIQKGWGYELPETKIPISGSNPNASNSK